MAADLLHALRRWWWKVSRRKAGSMTRCYDCGRKLTSEEMTFYGWSCERCEAINFHRFEALEREHMGDPDRETGIYARGVQAVHKSAPIQKRERPLPELPEAKVMVRDTDNEPEGGGWIVDCDCEGPLSYSLEAGEALYTSDQMREYARTALGVDSPDGAKR